MFGISLSIREPLTSTPEHAAIPTTEKIVREGYPQRENQLETLKRPRPKPVEHLHQSCLLLRWDIVCEMQ